MRPFKHPQLLDVSVLAVTLILSPSGIREIQLEHVYFPRVHSSKYLLQKPRGSKQNENERLALLLLLRENQNFHIPGLIWHFTLE